MSDETSSGCKRRWRVLLDGAQAEQATQTILAIAESLGELPPAARRRIPHELALFFAYLESAFPNHDHGARAALLVDEAAELIASETLPPRLFGGFTGIAWTVHHLYQAMGDDDPNEEIDQVLCEHVARSPWVDPYDLISGLVGYGVYSADRLPRPAAIECLRHIVARLDEIAERCREGVTWLTRPEHLDPRERELHANGRYNLGVAHGVPGVIALLAEVDRSGIAGDRGRALLEGAVAWLLAQRLSNRESVSFPYHVARCETARPARAAWCYGDPGVAATLLSAARMARRPDWEREALEIATVAARRPMESSGVDDAGFCHGAAGLAHIFNCLHQASGDPELGNAARRWVGHVLNLRRDGEAIAGYPSWSPTSDGTFAWKPDATLLGGAVGVGLALLAAVTPIEPCWDRLLLLSSSSWVEPES